MAEVKVKLNLNITSETLDGDWQQLPQEIMAWSSAYADAVKESQEAENQRVLIRSKVERKVRLNPKDYGFEKMTEDSIKSTVNVQQEVVDIEQVCVDAKHAVNTIKAIVEALDVKRSSLKYLTELTLVGYTGSAALPAGMKRN